MTAKLIDEEFFTDIGNNNFTMLSQVVDDLRAAGETIECLDESLPTFQSAQSLRIKASQIRAQAAHIQAAANMLTIVATSYDLLADVDLRSAQQSSSLSAKPRAKARKTTRSRKS